MTAAECWTSSFGVYFDDLDLNGHLHNARLVVLVERAQTELFERLGGAWSRAGDRHEDLRYVVRELHLEFTAPVTSPGRLRIGLQAREIGRTSAVYGFRCRFGTEDAEVAIGPSGHRQGRRCRRTVALDAVVPGGLRLTAGRRPFRRSSRDATTV